MASRRQRSVFARIWGLGLVQSVAQDLVILVGLVLVGAGIWQISAPAVWIYAGFVCVVGGGLWAAVSARERATPRRGGEP